MFTLSDTPDDQAWDIPGCKGAMFYHRVATSLDLDIANAAAAEMASQAASSTEFLQELGLGGQHLKKYAEALASQAAVTLRSKAGIYATFFQAIALAEICGTRFEGLQISKDEPMTLSRSHLAKLFQDRSRRTLWIAQVLALEVPLRQAGNASASAPNGTSATGAKTAADAPS